MKIEYQGSTDGWRVSRGDTTLGRAPTRDVARQVRRALKEAEAVHGTGTRTACEVARNTLRPFGLEDCLA